MFVTSSLANDPNFFHPKPAPLAPDGCFMSDDTYALLKDCWKQDSGARPTFTQILERLEAMDGQLKRSSLILESESQMPPIDGHAITIPDGYGPNAKLNAVAETAWATTIGGLGLGEPEYGPAEEYDEDGNDTDGYAQSEQQYRINKRAQPHSEHGDDTLDLIADGEDYDDVIGYSRGLPSLVAGGHDAVSEHGEEHRIINSETTKTFPVGNRAQNDTSPGNTGHARGLPQLQCTQKRKKGNCTKPRARSSQSCSDHTCPQQGCTLSKSTAATACKKHTGVVVNASFNPRVNVSAQPPSRQQQQQQPRSGAATADDDNYELPSDQVLSTVVNGIKVPTRLSRNANGSSTSRPVSKILKSALTASGGASRSNKSRPVPMLNLHLQNLEKGDDSTLEVSPLHPLSTPRTFGIEETVLGTPSNMKASYFFASTTPVEFEADDKPPSRQTSDV